VTCSACELLYTCGRLRAAVFFTLSLLLTSACSAPQTREMLSDKGAHQQRTVLLDVPFFPQTQYHCGPAALAGLLNYYGREITPEQLIPQTYLPGKRGSLQPELKAALRRQQLIAYPLQSNHQEAIRQLLRALDEGYPVLVMQNLSINWFPQWHYAVVTGYDLDHAELILNSGPYEDYRMDLSRFERTWRRGGFWALLASPPADIPALADPITWGRAALESEETGYTQTAFTAYQAALQRWPENEAALLGSGNTSYSLARYGQAARSFYQLALSSSSQQATGWNNLAFALAALHCPQAARKAAERAHTLSPDNQAVQNTVSDFIIADTGEAGRGATPTADPGKGCGEWMSRVEAATIPPGQYKF